jgi:hypothetical protein
MTEVIKHADLAQSRLATQFREASNLINYLRTLLSESDELEGVLQDTLNNLSIDDAENFDLDVIGEIVGQPRVFIDADGLTYFGYFGHPQAESYGDLYDPSVGSRYLSLGEPPAGFRELSDPEYRVYIRAKIAKNHTHTYPEEMISQVKFLFGDVPVELSEGVMTCDIHIGRKLTVNEKYLLESGILAKPLGVEVTYTSD